MKRKTNSTLLYTPNAKVTFDMENYSNPPKPEIKDPITINQTNFTSSDPFMCNVCIHQFENERLIANKDNEYFIEEEMDLLGLDINPDMQEETKCQYCLKKNKNTDAIFLFEGYPCCLLCSKMKNIESNKDLNYNSLNQILNDTTLLNSSLGTDKKTLKRHNTHAHSGEVFFYSTGKLKYGNSNQRSQSKSLADFSHLESENDISKTSRNKKSYLYRSKGNDVNTNLNIIYDKEVYNTNPSINNKEEQDLNEYVDNNKRRGITFLDFSHKQIDNKIMNMVTTKISSDMKFKNKNINLLQLEKMCKSLDYIFENTQKVLINLPIIFQGDKNSTKDFEWIKNCEVNGNYLFIFLDSNKEFLFGFICNTFSGKKTGRLFKKFYLEDDVQSPKNLKHSQIEYADQILENIILKNNLILVENYFSFDLFTFKFTIDNLKLSKFFTITRNRTLICSQISFINIFDMC